MAVVKKASVSSSTPVGRAVSSTSTSRNVQGPMTIGPSTYLFPNSSSVFNPSTTSRSYAITPSGGQTLAPRSTSISGGGQITQQAASTYQDPHINPGTGVWDDNYYAANSGGGFQMPNFEQTEPDWDALYAGANAQLSAAEQGLRGDQPITEANIRSQGEAQKSEYDQLRSKGLSQYEGQRGETNQQLADAMKMARQYFNEFSQNYLSRFGTGTSAGGAALELLGRGTQGVMGQAQNTANQNMSKISDAMNQLGQYVDTQKAQIGTNVSNKLAEADQWFKNQIAQINASRVGLESDKAAKRYEALRQREDFTNNIKYQAAVQQAEWDNYMKQQVAGSRSAAGGYQIGNYSPETLLGTQRSMGNIPVIGGQPVQGPGLGWHGDYAQQTPQGTFAGIQSGSPISMLNRGGRNLVQLPNGLFYDPETGQTSEG